MCTPQLKAQTAALQGAANSNPSATSGAGGAPPMIDPLRRRVLAMAPFSGTSQYATSMVSTGGASDLAAASRNRPDFSRPNPAAIEKSLDQRTNQSMLMVDKLIANQPGGLATIAGARPGAPLKSGPAPDFDETHAPTPQSLAEAAIKVRNLPHEARTFEPPTKEVRPFILADRGGYRTTPENRAWLAGIERMAKTTEPYPSGTPGDGGSSRARSAARVWAGYLYTLPEVKAFLDVLSKTEGSVRDGYLTSQYPKPPLKDFATFNAGGPRGRYQIEPASAKKFGANWFSRNDFGPVTQDLIAITLLVKDGAIDKLLAGDLRGAFSAASHTFSSVPMGAKEDYSGYIGRNWNPGGGPNSGRQPAGAKFDDLPAIFLARLNSRRTEFRDAQSAWEKSKILPWAFISPFRWHNFGLRGF